MKKNNPKLSLWDVLFIWGLALVAFAVLVFLCLAPQARGQAYTNAAPQARTHQFVFTNYPAQFFITNNNLGTAAAHFGGYNYSAGLSTNLMLVYTNLKGGQTWYMVYNDLGWRSLYRVSIWDIGMTFPDVALSDPFLTGGTSATNQWWQNGSGNTNGGITNIFTVVALWNTTTNTGWYNSNAPAVKPNLDFGN